MLADSLIVPECIYRPGSFSGLMTIYESNFLKFDQLCGDRIPEGDTHISRVDDDCDLHLTIIRREPYTSTLTLTYWFDEADAANGRVPDPDLLIRVYHDASLVEAVTSRDRHRHRVLQELARSHAGELDRRWRLNMMLNKWLDYLLDNGHRFV